MGLCLDHSPPPPGVHSPEEDSKLPATVIWSMFHPEHPVECILGALDHVTILSKYLDQEELVSVLIPLILHPSLTVRIKLM